MAKRRRRKTRADACISPAQALLASFGSPKLLLSHYTIVEKKAKRDNTTVAHVCLKLCIELQCPYL
jgi:hypothetical protein